MNNKVLYSLLLAALLAFCADDCYAQKRSTKKRVKHGYAMLSFLSGFSDKNNSLGGAVNFGIKPGKKFSAGLGFEVTKFKRMTTFYVPVYADFRYTLFSTKSIEVFAMAQPGYGFFGYKNDQIDSIPNSTEATTSFIRQKGGFYFSTGLGIKSSLKPSPFISLRYGFYQLTTDTADPNSYFKDKIVGNIRSLILNVGIAF